MIDKVYTIERHAALADAARLRFLELGYSNIEVRVVIVPVGEFSSGQSLQQITRRTESDYEEEDLGGVSFVPLVGEHAWTEDGRRAAGSWQIDQRIQFLRSTIGITIDESFGNLDDLLSGCGGIAGCKFRKACCRFPRCCFVFTQSDPRMISERRRKMAKNVICLWYDGTAEEAARFYAQTFRWCKDKWGLSWQITPRVLLEATTDSDRAAAKRAFEAMMNMKKIDIATIEAARRGPARP
jgi:hypothetical protein